MYTQPSINIFGIRLDEPVTTFTDLLVSAVCFYAFYRLNKIGLKNDMLLYLKIYFFSMGIATTIGGLVGHGFLYAFKYNEVLQVSPWKLPGWLTSMISVAMVERASIEYAKSLTKPNIGKIFSWLNIIELLTFMSITFSTLNFFWVEVHTTYGLLIIVAGFNLIVFIKKKSKGSKLFLWAVGVSVLSALIFMNEWAISKWFNHFDISHTLLAISAVLFYRGAIRAINEPVVIHEE